MKLKTIVPYIVLVLVITLILINERFRIDTWFGINDMGWGIWSLITFLFGCWLYRSKNGTVGYSWNKKLKSERDKIT